MRLDIYIVFLFVYSWCQSDFLTYQLKHRAQIFNRLDLEFYRMSQKNLPTFGNSLHQNYFTDLNHSNSSSKSKDRSIFVIFLIVLPSLEILVNSTL